MESAPVVPDLEVVLASAQLPALPQSAVQILELSRDSENGPAELALAIEADPGLTGQVLRFVNSSYFGFSREISSVKLAITLVGMRTIKNFVLWSAVFSLLPNPRCGPFSLKALWQDSLRRGLFARAFGRMLGMREAEDLFAAALLQDMAVPLLAKELPEQYERLLEARQSGQTRLSELEWQRFGWTHAEAAGRMARSWRLPEGFARLIERHASLDEARAAGCEAMGELAVGLSALLPAASDSGWPERSAFLEAYDALGGVEAAPLIDLLADVDREFKRIGPLLHLTPPRVGLADMVRSSGASFPE